MKEEFDKYVILHDILEKKYLEVRRQAKDAIVDMFHMAGITHFEIPLYQEDIVLWGEDNGRIKSVELIENGDSYYFRYVDEYDEYQYDDDVSYLDIMEVMARILRDEIKFEEEM